MRRLFVLLLLLAACRSPHRERTLEAEAAWRETSHAFSADVDSFMKRYRAASPEQQKAMLNGPGEPRHKWTPRVRALALQYRGNPASVRFDRWLLQNGGVIDPRFADEAAQRVLAMPLAGARMRRVPAALRYAAQVRGREKTLADLNAIARTSPDPSLRQEALTQRQLLLDVDGLRAGDAAPPLRGTAFDGKRVDLARYRGSVVMVDFWGAWCGPCVAAIPETKRISERFAGAPFAIVGVNTDRDRALASSFIAAQTLTWTNIADGSQDGPVTTAWRVRRFPAVYVVDRDGRIAAAEPQPGALVPTIERLLSRR